MKTIEERAQEAWIGYEYRDGNYWRNRGCFKNGFIAGAKSEREELLRWRDPKKELPDYYHTVLIKYIKGGLYTYAAAWLSVSDNNEYLWTIAETNMLISDRSVHYWRPIVELPYDGEKL